MGAKKKDGREKPARKKLDKDKITKVVGELTHPEATATSRVRSLASALDLEKVVEILDTSEDVMAAVRLLLRREEGRYTLEEAAEKAGISPEKGRQINLACGFADPGPDARVFTDEDIEVLQLFEGSTAIFGEDVAIQNVRVLGLAMSRVADAFISSFATMIGRRSLEADLTDEDFARANETAVGLLPSAVRAMDVLLRRHMELKSRPDFALGDEWEGVDAVDRAVGFCDLVGYTALAQQISDNRLASTLRAFETTAADLITEHGADLVKLIGDEVMFVAPDAATAVRVALALADRFGEGDVLPPVRCGVNAGRVIVREGDYHGPVVNLAARIVKLAPPGGVMAPAELANELGTEFTFEDAGDKELKGFADLVPLVIIRR
ncbi:MAG TPA: adenylate/guanylate cyclase domain-containing protein [Actinomycetota bacterium]|jgi:adenylate cyclase|nr:adenylate/guanylate cyclase domain-containing protein [Actinomycetota bacterium]